MPVNVIVGDDADEFIEGTTGDDLISALGGDDYVSGNGGNDTLSGGDGSDVLVAGSGSSVLYGDAGSDVLDSINGADSLYGGDGDDFLFFLDFTSDDLADGGAGYDSLRFGDLNSTGDQAIIIGDSPDGTKTVTIDGRLMDVSGIETVSVIYTGFGNDTITGSDDAEGIASSGGDDVIYAMGGDDYLSSSAGDDSLFGGAGDDEIVLLDVSVGDMVDGGAGDDTLNLLASFGSYEDLNIVVTSDPETGIAVSWNGDMLDISGIETLGTVSTGEGDDTIIGSDGDEAFQSFGGSDHLEGGAGDDILDAGSGEDTVIAGAGDDIILLEDGSVADVVDGGDGQDTLYISSNYYSTEDLNIVVTSNPQSGVSISWNGDLMDLTGVETLGSLSTNQGDDTIIGSDDSNFFASFGGSDYLVGGASDDYLSAGVGDDTVLAGGGDDWIAIQDASLADVVDGGDGYDTLEFYMAFSYVGYDIKLDDQPDGTIDVVVDGDRFAIDNIESVYVNGSYGDDTITGNDLADILFGDGGHDEIIGGDGKDILDGGAGDDVLDGGKGQDTLAGGEGADAFVFHRGGGKDSLWDFEVGIDHIVIGDDLAAAGLDDLKIIQQGDDAVINMMGAMAFLHNVDGADLTQDDFMFL